MSNNGHQDILKYFKFVVFFVGRILGKQKNLFNINKLQEIFYPLGDANRHLKAHHIPQKLRFCGAPFYYKHPALVKPSLPALKPLRSLQPRHVLRPSGKNSPYVQKLRALPVQGVTSVMKMAPSSGKRMACAPHCFSLPTGCTRLLWPRLKAHLPASSPPPSRFSRLYTIPCRYSPWHKAEIHRPR